MQRELLFNAIYAQLYNLSDSQLTLVLINLSDLNMSANATQNLKKP